MGGWEPLVRSVSKTLSRVSSERLQGLCGRGRGPEDLLQWQDKPDIHMLLDDNNINIWRASCHLQCTVSILNLPSRGYCSYFIDKKAKTQRD